ncbi:MAG: peptidoglycan bridge formation glycyltransferase FemA/FemB family protein, partial [Anaerolineaceae bacterium]|nr:peptidoglycan bridge formation glycyltransferase FemA/FemB family protein [Anaerolineaceae bacterium]
QVRVRLGSTEDLSSLYRMYAETSVRDGFVIRPQAYYEELWRVFMDRGMADVIIAEVDGDPVAGLVLFSFGGKAWYLHGMSTSAQREKMPNYLLQWEAIRRARELGCTRYDLWGAPDDFNEQDGMWGVYRFKEGLGGNVIHTIGAWDYPVRRLGYLLYNRIIPLLLSVMRRRGKADTQRQLSM